MGVLVFDAKANFLASKKGILVSVPLFDVNDYPQVNSFVRERHIEDPSVSLCNASLLLITSICTLFCMYGLGALCTALCGTFHSQVIADSLTTVISGCLTACIHIMNESLNVMLLIEYI